MKIEVFLKISVLKSLANLSRKHQRWKTPALLAHTPVTLLKTDSNLSVFL